MLGGGFSSPSSFDKDFRNDFLKFGTTHFSSLVSGDSRSSLGWDSLEVKEDLASNSLVVTEGPASTDRRVEEEGTAGLQHDWKNLRVQDKGLTMYDLRGANYWNNILSWSNLLSSSFNLWASFLDMKALWAVTAAWNQTVEPQTQWNWPQL